MADARIVTNEDGNTCVQYAIVISLLGEACSRLCNACGLTTSHRGDIRCFAVYRGFSEFHDLQSRLSEEFPNAEGMPSLPARTLFRSYDPRFISSRRASLRTYVAVASYALPIPLSFCGLITCLGLGFPSTPRRYVNNLMRFRRTRTQGPLNVGGVADDDRRSKCPDLSHSEELAAFFNCLVRDRSRPSTEYYRELLPLVAEKLGFPINRNPTSGTICCFLVFFLTS